MTLSGADLRETVRRRVSLPRIIVVTPTLHATIIHHPAGMVESGADLDEDARRRIGATVRLRSVGSRARDATVPPYYTVVAFPGAHLREPRREELATPVDALSNLALLGRAG